MKILLWAPFGAGMHYWGPGTSAFRLYKANKDKSVKVTLVHGSDFQEDFPEVYDQQIQLGQIDKKDSLSFILYLKKSYKWIRKHHQEYDAFHGITAFFYTFLPALWFQHYGKPAYIKVSGIQGGFENNGRLSRFTGFSKFRLNKANKLAGYISISSDITASLKKNGVEGNRIFYLPNGVDTQRFHSLSEDRKSSLKKKENIRNVFTITYVGGLTLNKRVLETVKAVHFLKTKGYALQFLIVGPDRSGGVVESEIVDYITQNQLKQTCIRITHTTQPELYFKMSDVFVLNSKFEGLSNSLLEAMASGLPCIASPASGTVDLIENGENGFLTDGTAKQIAEKLKILLEDTTLHKHMSEQAETRIKQGFSVDQVWQKHLNLFRKK